jgi:molybdate transport system regulatory protein
MARKKSARLKGDVILLHDGEQTLAGGQIELLRAIQACGSISKAAKQVGISYKTAWDRIDAMNNMSDEPLVVRTAGGAHGGGTILTEFGERIVTGFASLQAEHAQFIDQLGRKLQSLTDVADFVKGGTVQTSARNQFRGRVLRVTAGAVNAEVEIDIGANQHLIAMITQESVDKLQLGKDVRVVALIKASSVLISNDPTIASSARNKLVGTISRVEPGAVNSEIVIDVGGDKSVCAIITSTSAEQLALREGGTACALFKAPSVILLREP